MPSVDTENISIERVFLLMETQGFYVVILTKLDMCPLDGSRRGVEAVEGRVKENKYRGAKGFVDKNVVGETWLGPSSEEEEKSLVMMWKKNISAEKRPRGGERSNLYYSSTTHLSMVCRCPRLAVSQR